MADSGEPKSKLSRRDFLKVAGVYLGGLGLNRYLPQTVESKPEKNLVGETIQIGNLELTPIITEHDQQTWEKDGRAIIETLKNYRVIIPEYFPPDFEPHLKDHPLFDVAVDFATGYNKLNYAFMKIAEYAQDSNKPVWVVDPAYSEAFVKLRASKNWWIPLVSGVLAASGINLISAGNTKHSEKSAPQNPLMPAGSKPTFAATMAGLGIGTYLMGGEATPLRMECDVRHVFIAESLIQLGNYISSHTKTAIIYPHDHWYGEEGLTVGILYYLQNSDLRKEQFNKYCDTFSGKSAWEDFFKIRNYKPTREGWEQQPAIILSTPAK